MVNLYLIQVQEIRQTNPVHLYTDYTVTYVFQQACKMMQANAQFRMDEPNSFEIREGSSPTGYKVSSPPKVRQ